MDFVHNLKFMSDFAEKVFMKKEYRSAIRSKELIKNAFLQLMYEKEIDKITVTDIVKRAKINRSTFYAHYPDVRAIIEALENEIFQNMDNILSEFKYRKFFLDPLPTLQRINEYLEADLELYRTLILYKETTGFFDKFGQLFLSNIERNESVPPKVRNSVTFRLRTNLFAGGMMKIYEQWFTGNLDCDLNDISVEMAKIITETAKEMLE